MAAKNSAKNPPSKRTGKVPCGVCLAPVVDGKDEALLCEGECGLWLHRGCASIPPSDYEPLSTSDEPFVCLCCSNSQLRKELTQQGKELQSLKATVLQLRQEVTQLRAPTQNPTPATPATPAPNLSYSNIVKQAPNPSTETPAKKVPSTTAPDKKYDRKFNIVIYGIKENPEHTNRYARLAKDLESVITITNSLVPGVTKGSIRDCTRLGRYSPSRDRPLLVKFNCAHEASSILANRSKLKTLPGISIKPDMSPQEKATESILLKERYSLTSEEVSIKSIKIVGSSLFVNNVKHGSVDLKYSCTNHQTSRQPSITILR